MSVAFKDETEQLPDEFKDAFNEHSAEVHQPSDDDAMGISTPAEETAVAKVEGEEEGAEGAKEAAEPADTAPETVENEPASEAAKEPVEEDEDAGLSPKELQRKKSQEGRLRKMEADLQSLSEQGKAREIAQAVVKAEAKADPDQQQAAEEIVEGLEDGSLSADAALKQLTEDFGEDFVRMVSAVVAKTATEIAGKKVSEGVQKVSDEVKQITSQISDANEQKHFEAIATAVPDFFDLVKSPGFQTYLESANDDIKSVASKGTTKQVIAMMKDYKTASEPAAPKPAAAKPAVKQAAKEDPAMSAAEGVRSGATRLPEQPAQKDDFEGAWAEASKLG